MLPCFNAELFLAEAIESALAQTRAPHRGLVVGDDYLYSPFELPNHRKPTHENCSPFSAASFSYRGWSR